MLRTPEAPWVTACIPSYRSARFIRTSVLSLLGQSYPYVRVIVISDGDPEPPWRALAGIADPRLIRFHTEQNSGPYYALSVALAATPDKYFLVQDADDWSHPRRIELLLKKLHESGSDYVFSQIQEFRDGPGGEPVQAGFMVRGPPRLSASPTMENRIFHHGLYRRKALTQIGGYFGGYRLNYDKGLSGVLQRVARVAWVPAPMY